MMYGMARDASARGDLTVTLMCFVPPALMVVWLIGYTLWMWLA